MLTRRTFAQWIGAIGAFLALPKTAVANAEPQTVTELEAWFAREFDCREGHPRSYCRVAANGDVLPMDTPLPDGYRKDFNYSEWAANPDKRRPYVRGVRVYAVRGFGAVGKDANETALVKALYDDVKPLAGGRPILYWRRHVDLSSLDERVEYDEESRIVEEDAFTPELADDMIRRVRQWALNMTLYGGAENLDETIAAIRRNTIQPGMVLDPYSRTWVRVLNRESYRRISVRFALFHQDIAEHEDGTAFPLIA